MVPARLCPQYQHYCLWCPCVRRSYNSLIFLSTSTMRDRQAGEKLFLSVFHVRENELVVTTVPLPVSVCQNVCLVSEGSREQRDVDCV